MKAKKEEMRQKSMVDAKEYAASLEFNADFIYRKRGTIFAEVFRYRKPKTSAEIT